jgi:D-serine deaminase-like pyridoxal phosphate-dependent protein
LTELEAGTYVLMDTEYFIVGGQDGNMTRYTNWQPAMTILTTVHSQHHPNIITTDHGNKALAKKTDEVKGIPWLQVGVLGAEYGALTWKDGKPMSSAWYAPSRAGSFPFSDTWPTM